jgi:hypothetical protein
VNIESFDFATGDRRGVPAKAPGASGGDATKTDADAKDPNRKPAKRAKKEEPAAKTAEPAPEGEPAASEGGGGPAARRRRREKKRRATMKNEPPPRRRTRERRGRVFSALRDVRART